MKKRTHVIPVGDEEIHCAQESCWCKPVQTEPGVFTHNAKDCREAQERITGQNCSEGWVLIGEEVSEESQLTLEHVQKIRDEMVAKGLAPISGTPRKGRLPRIQVSRWDWIKKDPDQESKHPGRTGWVDDGFAYFHGWHTEAVREESSIVSETVAIIEREDGSICTLPPCAIKFLD